MTAQEFEQVQGELAEMEQAEEERRRRVRERTEERLRQIGGYDAGFNPPITGDDFWPDEVFP